MNLGRLSFCLILLAFVSAHPAFAETVIEAWRSPFGAPCSVSVNTADGSCWAATGSILTHLGSDGATLAQVPGFGTPLSVSVNPSDGSFWVADSASCYGDGWVAHVAADGDELWRGTSSYAPSSVSVNPNDGSCWVADYGNSWGSYCAIVHLDANGVQLWRGTGYDSPTSVSVNPNDGSCWVADYGNNQVVHLSSTGVELWRGDGFDRPHCVAVDASDDSCWVADLVNDQVVHLDKDGNELWRGGAFTMPDFVAVDPSDSSCWVLDKDEVVHLDKDGNESWRGGGFGWLESLSVDTTDGSCWVADSEGAQVVHLSASGTQLWQGESPFNRPSWVSVNPTDDSCWVSDTEHGELVHLAEDGSELLRSADTIGPVSVNPTDGSLWVADTINNEVVHLNPDGSEQWRGGTFYQPRSPSVNPTDGSCWVADLGIYNSDFDLPTYSNSAVVRLAADGSESSRSTGFNGPNCVSVNPSDGSCWVADTRNLQVVHLAADGTQLWRSTRYTSPVWSVSVNPTDGSCWATTTSKVMHFSAVGTQLWTGTGYDLARSVSVDPVDGSCWVADYSADQIVRLADDGAELWRGSGFGGPQHLSVNAKDGSCWVAELRNSHVVHLVIVGTVTPTAAFVASPLAGTAPLQVSFTSQCLGTPRSWLWDFGDAATSDQRNPSHQYTNAGTYTVSLTVANDAGSDTETKADYITVTPPQPAADFSATPTTGDAPLTVNFTDLSTGGPTSWEWDFGDGGSSAEQNPSHTYADVGSYTVSLTATNAGGPDTETKMNYITVRFTDVAEDHWACQEILACVEAGIVAGYDDGCYHGDWPVTRDQMAVYISRALAGGDESVPDFTATPTFPDVDAEHWALNYVEYAVDQSVIGGYDDGTYHPEYEVTRDQMAVYVARSICDPTGEDGLAGYVPAAPRDFPDVPNTGYGDDGTEPFWAYTHIEYCVEHDVVNGYDDGYYHPDWPVTRDQMAVYVARAFGLTM